jgi:hypothetical protein
MNTDKLKESLAGLNQLEKEYHQLRDKAYKGLLEECYDLKNPKELVTALYCHEEIPEQVKLEAMWETGMLPFEIGDNAIMQITPHKYTIKCHAIDYLKVYDRAGSNESYGPFVLHLVCHITFFVDQWAEDGESPFIRVPFKMNKSGRWGPLSIISGLTIDGFRTPEWFDASFDIVDMSDEKFRSHCNNLNMPNQFETQ